MHNMYRFEQYIIENTSVDLLELLNTLFCKTPPRGQLNSGKVFRPSEILCQGMLSKNLYACMASMLKNNMFVNLIYL